MVSTLLPSAADGKPWPSGAGCMKDGLRYHRIVNFLSTAERALTKALIGGGGAYSYIRVLPDEFLLKSTVMTTDFKRNSSGRTRIYEYPPPAPN